eukprot:COSAG06_NODE_8416_length_2181_cov_1.284822_2_plen_109_part_00
MQYIELRAGDKWMEGLQPAAALLQKVHTRKHYRYIGESVIGRSSDSDGGGGSSSQAAKSKEEWQSDCKRACIRWLREELDEVCCDNPKKNVLFLSFPYACPEPVLVKR